jgi:hypothetical protein
MTEQAVEADEAVIADNLNKLREMFSEGVLALPPGTHLYHQSADVTHLLAQGAFDPSHSNFNGSFFFTAEPVPGTTNVEATAKRTLILVEDGKLKPATPEAKEQVSKREPLTTTYDNLGFDGIMHEPEIEQVSSYVRKGTRTVMLLPRGVQAINRSLRKYETRTPK